MAVNESYNFDDGTLQGWTVYEEGSNVAIDVDPSAALDSSTEGVLVSYSATSPDDAYIHKALGTSYSDIYVRFKLKLVTGFEGAFGDRFIRFITFNSTSRFAIQDFVQLYWTGTIIQLRDSLGTNTHELSFDTEYDIEIRRLKDATNGGYQIWVDDVLVIDDLAYNTDANTIGYLNIGVVVPSASFASGGSFYLDEIEIGDARIGGVTPVTGTFDLPDVTTYTTDTVGAPFTSASHTITVTLGDGTDTADLEVTYSPKSGYAVQEITSAVKTKGSAFEDFVGDVLDTSQVLHPTHGGTTQFLSDGTVLTDQTSNFYYQFWDASDGTWKREEVLIEVEADTTPNAFSFTDTTGLTTSFTTVSNTITVSGIEASAAISITTTDGMEYSINGGAYTSASGTVDNGDTVQLRVTTSASWTTEVSGTLDIGGVTDTWSVTTSAEPVVGGDFRVTVQDIVSNIVTDTLR